jgi:high-affinity nickel permease
MPDHAWMLFTAAAALGFRHGIDRDHLAAISDIVGTTTTPEAATKPFHHSMLLATAYAVGHACVVAILGLAALNCKTLLPSWTDSIMERAVGCTLIFLAA